MTMRSPVVAILWENWRLTRVEAAWRLALGIVASTAVPVVFGVAASSFVEEREAVMHLGAAIALFLVVFPNLVNWQSTAQLNGYRPGFPFHHSVLALGGEVVESRDATLEEIFLARAGRTRQPAEVA